MSWMMILTDYDYGKGYDAEYDNDFYDEFSYDL